MKKTAVPAPTAAAVTYASLDLSVINRVDNSSQQTVAYVIRYQGDKNAEYDECQMVICENFIII